MESNMKKRILLADDDSSIREALSKVLRCEDYEVVSAVNGEEAIEELKSKRIDLLLLDLGLPVKDGWGVVIWLTQVNPLLPVLVITGRWNQLDLAKKMGADALMEKPLDVPLLLKTIRELMDEPMGCRAQRPSHQTRAFRYVPCDNRLLREMLCKRLDAPYPSNLTDASAPTP